MPEMDGRAALKRIRATWARAQCALHPRVQGHHDHGPGRPKERGGSLLQGRCDLLRSKPIDRAMLLHLLKNLNLIS